jgi:hypothetical protein
VYLGRQAEAAFTRLAQNLSGGILHGYAGERSGDPRIGLCACCTASEFREGAVTQQEFFVP